MKIWSVSCTLAVLLLVVTAQRRGSRRFDLSQASDSPAEDEDELSSTRSHRFERQRQSAEPDSDRGPISRSRSRTGETEAQVGSRRPGTRQRESVVDDSNLRQGSRRGKGLTFRSRSEPEEENHLSTERTRSRTNKEERRNSFPSRLDSDVISHTESATVRSQNINSRFSDKEKTKSRNENDFTRSSPVERRPLLPITSISPEDVTFPSRSRSRQTKAPEEAITSEPKGNSRNLQRSSEGTRLRSRTLEQNFPSRSSSRGTTRSRVPEVASGTSTPSRTRSEFSPLRRKPIDLPGQDVESKIFSRRRNLGEEKVKPTIDDSSRKTGFLSTDEVKSTLPVTSEGFTEQPLYSSNAGTEEVINSDIPVNKQIENVVDALPTASNDALTLLPNEVLQSTLHDANVRDRSKPQDSPLKNNDNTGLTKALHARSRGQERPSENESENVSRSRTRQRSKESDSESRKPTNRGRISTSEPTQGLSTTRERFSPRSRGNISNRESEQKEVDASNTRTRAQVRFPTRTSAESRGSSESSTEGSTVNRGRATSVNIATPTVELQTESSPIRSPSRSGGRRTLPKLTADLEPTAKPSRGRGQVKQGKLNDNEKGSGSGKDEDVSEDDNYPEVYKQLKKAGNGPKEILALLKAKKKQREAQQAQRRQQQQSTTAEATTAATFFSDLNTEEDNVKPSIESSLRRRPSEKFSREAESSATERSSSRSASRQRSLTPRGSRNYNDLGKAEEEVSVNTQSVRTGTDSKDYKKLLEERKKKYSAIPRENDFDQDKENGVEIKSEKPSYSKDYLKSLNDLGLDPKTLGPTEPTTERERFVPSSRRTKSYSYRASTEQISDEVLNTSTFKPRYQLYQAKNRKKYLNKLGGKESLGSKEETSIKSVLDEEVDQKVKKLRFGASSRPPYTPPRRVTTPLPPPRLSARRPGRFTPSSISVAFDKPDDQEPVTIQVFDLEARAPKLESASLVTEASSTAMTSSSETPSMEGSSEQSSSEASSEDSSVETSVTESPLENSVIDDETVIPMSISTSPATTTSTSTTTQPSTTTTTISAKPTISTTVKPKTTKIPSTTTTKKPVTTSTTQKPTTTTQKPTSTTQKPTTTTQKPTTTTQKPTTTTQKPTTTTQKPTTTTQKPITTTQKSSTTTTKKPNTTTQKPTTTTKAPSTTTTTRKPTTQKPTTTTKKPPTPTTPKPTTKKPVSDKTPPSAPKPPQQQPLTSSTSTTTTEAATTEDQLAARSNLIQKSEVSTVPEMILTSAQTLQPLTFTSSPSSTNRPQSESSSGYVAYALLPNNTLVRRVSARSTTPPTEVPFFVYGLYPNGTIVRKYPNGTVVPDDPSPESNELVAEVDPYNKKELSDILERDRPLAYLYPATSSTSLTPTSMASTEATSTTISSTTTTTESTTFSTTTTTTTQKPTTTTKKPTTTTKKPTQKPKPKAATTQKPVTTKATTTSTSPTPITTQQTTTTTTEIPQPSPTTTTTPEPTTTPQPTTTTPKPTTTLKPTTPKPTTSKPTTPKPTTPKPTTPKPTTPKPTTPKPTTPKPTTPKPSTPKPTTPKKPSTTTPTTTTMTTTTSTTTTTTPSTATEKNIEPMIVSGVESALSSPSSPKSETKENDEDCDICGDEVSSSSKATPSNGLSKDDVALLNNLLRLQPSDSERSASVDSSSSLPPSGPEDDDIANRIIQLAIERAQSTTASPVSVSVSTDGLDLQQLSSSPQPSFERDGKSIAPPMMDSMAVETSPSPKPGGKISLWVVPEGENEQTTKAPQKLSPEEEQVLTALLAAPQSPSSISVRDQLLLAELLAAGQNNNQGGQISTTKRPRKKKRPSSTPPPPPPPLSPLAALFGPGGRGGGLFASGAAPPTGSGEEGDASARPQQGGLLVNAAINITRAVSQFMGLVLQSAAQSFSTFLASRTRNFADYVARGGAIS